MQWATKEGMIHSYNVIDMIFAHGKGGFCAHTVIGYHCPSRRPSREEARWWRRLPEWEKGKENGGAGDRALGIVCSC